MAFPVECNHVDTNEWWGDVRQVLIQKYGLTSSTAETAVNQRRQELESQIGQLIAHWDVEDIAESINAAYRLE